MSFSSFPVSSIIRGHHIYKVIWSPELSEELFCEVDLGNVHDPYAVAVKRTVDNITVGHVPHKILALCYLFLRRGTITCVVTGSRKYSSDLPQGDLD